MSEADLGIMTFRSGETSKCKTRMDNDTSSAVAEISHGLHKGGIMVEPKETIFYGCLLSKTFLG